MAGEAKLLRQQAACGHAHTLLVTDSGEMWCFGGNKFGQLGAKISKDALDPIRVDDGTDNDGERSLKGKRVIQVAAGSFHSAAVTANGDLYTWGLEAKGRLGHTDTWGLESEEGEATVRPRNPNLPCLIRAFTDKAFFPETVHIKYAACGADHTVAVDDQGGVYTWGLGNFGNLGHGDTKDQFTPRYVEGMREHMVAAVSAGAKHTAAVTSKGEVYTWGHGDGGRLGNGAKRGTLVPEPVVGLDGIFIQRISSGEAHNAALTDDGLVYTWGSGSFGRLGHGEEQDQYTPKLIDALVRTPVAMAACGAFHTALVTRTGELYTYGGGQYGKLGLSSETNLETPRMVVNNINNKRITQASCGFQHTCLISDNGFVLTCGFGGNGRLGHGTMDSHNIPMSVQLMQSRGVTGSASAMPTDDSGGEARDMQVDTDAERQQMELRAKVVAQVTCGAQHTLARTHEGSVFSWGEGEHGQLGQQDTEDYYAPVRVEGALTSKRITMVACGSQHSLAVTSAGELFAWGRGDAGQLGMGRLKDEDRPSAVTSLAGRFVTACAAGENHSACLADNGSLLTWGAGDMGKLGHGRGSRSQLLPRVVQDELAQHRVTQVSLGMAHTACVTSRGQVFAWGGGWFGRLGVGNTDNQYTPQRVTALQYRVISRLSCGSYHTIFCTEDGEVYVCGRGDSRLGLPGASDTLEPTLVVDLKHKQVNVIDVAAGEEHSLAMAANGGVWAWGKGRYGKLGVGSDDDCERPEQVAVEEEGGEGKDASLQPLSLGLYDSFQRLKGVKDIRGISTYSNHSVALDSYGQVFVFGCGGSGRLGLNNTDNATLATLLSNPLLPPAEDFDKLGTEGKEEGEEGGKGQGKGGDEKDAGDDLVDLGFDEEDEDKEEEGNQAMGGQEGSALAQTQALLQVFRTKDMEAGPPVGRVQQLLGSEPRGHRVDKIQESIESLLDVRAEALRLMRSCKSLEDEVKAIEHKIEVTVSSTVKRAIPSKAGAPITLKVPFDVQDNLVLFERVFSMFLANPMYLTNIFRHYLSTPDRRDATLAEGLEGEELFVELCFAVYGPMTQGRSERLFLVLVEQILQEEVRLAAAHTLSKFVLEFARADSVFGLFVTEYFRREENVVTLRNMFSEPLHEFLTETESGKAMDLNFDPVAVHNALEEDPTKHVDDLSATETLRRELYARGDIKAEVNARVARLMHVAQDWFDRIARAMTGLPFGVRWVCGKVLRYVTERFQVGDEDEANFQFMVGKFVLDRYIRPAIQFPKRFGLLGRNARLTTVQNVNLKLLADVLRHMAANSEYQAEQVWLKPLNSVIKQYSGAAQTMVRQLVDVEPDFSHDLLVDSFYEHLRLSPLVHKVQLNQLLYLRAILARDLSEVVVKPADPLEHMASKLFPSEVHREKARELVTRPREQDYGINLVIDTRFNEFPDGEPLLCPHSGVPLPEFLAPPDSQRMVLEEMFRVDESSRGGVALREILRGAKQLGASADLDGLKRYLSRMAKQGMEDGDLAMSLQARYAEDAIQDVELRSRNPSAALMIQLLQGIEDRAKKAERLDQEQSTFEALKTSIYNFRQQLVAKRAALTKYLTILRQGVKTQQNRRVVDGTALRSKEKLTPDNLVRATHKTGATEKTKLALDDEAQVLGAFAVFTYRQLSRRDVVLSLKFKKQTQKAIDPKKLSKKISFQFVALEDGTFDVTMLFNKDTVLDGFRLHIDELTKMERSMRHELVPENLHGEPSKVKLHVPSLLEMLTKELTARRLVLA